MTIVFGVGGEPDTFRNVTVEIGLHAILSFGLDTTGKVPRKGLSAPVSRAAAAGVIPNVVTVRVSTVGSLLFIGSSILLVSSRISITCAVRGAGPAMFSGTSPTLAECGDGVLTDARTKGGRVGGLGMIEARGSM